MKMVVKSLNACYMQKPWNSVKVKVLLGYFFLLLIAGVTVWIIYSEILQLTVNKGRISTLNKKVLYINAILTDLYEAEGLERTYAQTGNERYFNRYRYLMDSVYLRIDSLNALSDDPVQQSHIDTLLNLLDTKEKNLLELIEIKRAGSSEDLYNKAISRLTFNRDSIEHFFSVYKTLKTDTDSVYIRQKSRKFFERLVNVFSPDNKDSTLKINITQSVKVDSVLNAFSPADSVTQFLITVMEDLRLESRRIERQLERKEQDLLRNDQTITLQLRKVLAAIENDEFQDSFTELEKLQSRVEETVFIIAILGATALLIILIFMVLILKDISRSQQYRKELERAKAYAESLLKSKEQFMLGITHDLKTPLGSIVGYARLMADAKSDEQKHFYLTNINKSSEHILKLINDLVDFTRLETGKLKIDHVRFNLNTLIREIIEGFYPIAATKNLEIKNVIYVPENSEYRSDPLRLRQIFGNLISNAIKFTDKGCVSITVQVDALSGTSDRVIFEVEDTGIGISEKDREVIFEEFSRVAPKGDKNYEGAGLGLTISQRLVKLLKGTISVQSKPGEGSVFRVILSLEKSPSRMTNSVNKYKISKKTSFKHVQPVTKTHDTQPETLSPKSATYNAAIMSGRLMLIIDDDRTFLNMTAELLRKAGIGVVATHHPPHALILSEKIKYDLIMTDISMPAISGIELLRTIRKGKNYKTPVIAVTGQQGQDDVLKEAGFVACISKPYFPEQLVGCIVNILKGRKCDGSQNIDTSISEDLYSLEQINQFAVDDPEGVRQILTSFINTSRSDIALMKKYINGKTFENLSALAHKMLAMFRQLKAYHIVEPLVIIENSEKEVISEEELKQLALETVAKISTLIDVISEEQKLSVGA